VAGRGHGRIRNRALCAPHLEERIDRRSPAPLPLPLLDSLLHQTGDDGALVLGREGVIERLLDLL
jgi:hypothetical protein